MKLLNQIYDCGSEERIKSKHSVLKLKLESEIKIKTEKKFEVEKEISETIKTIEENKNKRMLEYKASEDNSKAQINILQLRFKDEEAQLNLLKKDTDELKFKRDELRREVEQIESITKKSFGVNYED